MLLLWLNGILNKFSRDHVTFHPSILYLKYWMSPNKPIHPDYYWGLSLLSCDIFQAAIVTEERVPPENRGTIKELCRAMHSSVIEQLPASNAFRSGADSVIYAIDYAIHSIYTDLTKSMHTFRDETESCRPYLLSSFVLATDKYGPPTDLLQLFNLLLEITEQVTIL